MRSLPLSPPPVTDPQFRARTLGPLLGLFLRILGLVGLATNQSAHAASSPRVDRQGMLLVDGQPRLILGLYENPADAATLRAAIAHGFNLFQCGPNATDLDRLRGFGARGWVNLGGALDLSTNTQKRSAQLTQTVEAVARHPALLLWEGPDEILWNQWWVPLETVRAELRTMRDLARTQDSLTNALHRAQSCLDRGLYPEFETARAEFWRRAGRPSPNPGVRVDDSPQRVRLVGDGLTAGIRHVRQLDPRHVIWLNHAPRNSLEDLRWFNRAADMAGCDIYPAPANLDVGHSDLTDMRLSSVGAYTRRMRQAAPGRSCAMVLQGFGWQDLRENVSDHQLALGIGRRPTFAESRFMAYDALLNGANAILYWGTAYLKPNPREIPDSLTGRPAFWSELLRVALELRSLEPAFLVPPSSHPRTTVAPTFGSHDSPALLTSLRRVGADDVLFVLNESPHGVRFTVDRLPSRLEGRNLFRLQTPEAHTIDGGRLEDGIKGYDVHVYATSRHFEPANP